MSTRSILSALVFALAATLAASAWAAEPTLSQVYQAAESGNLAEAQRMMNDVLRAHPDSAKAHYVEAELLAKQGRMASARDELNTAERLEPGLPFAKPQAVAALRREIGSSDSFRPAAERVGPAAGGGIPWLTLAGVALVAIIVLAFLAMRRRASATLPAGGGSSGYIPVASAQPGSMSPAAPMGPAGGGMGSGLLGSLATGAAIGGGIVAGEALANRLIGGHTSGVASPLGSVDQMTSVPQSDDLGGNDFGVTDSGSWDDGFSGGAGGGDNWT